MAAFPCKAKQECLSLPEVAAGSGVSCFPPCPEPRERAATVVPAVGGNARIAKTSGAAVSQPTRLWGHFSGVIPLPSISPPSVFKGI